MPVSTPVPRPHVPVTAMPTRAVGAGVLVEPGRELVRADPARRRRRSPGRPRARPTAGSRRAARAGPGTAACRTAGGPGRGPTGRGGGRAARRRAARRGCSSVSVRLRMTSARCSRKASPVLPLTSPTRSTSASSEPNSRTHLAAVFSPTPGMPGRLSLGSPRSAAKSGYCAGVRSYFVCTCLGGEAGHVARCRGRVIRTVTRSLTSWKRVAVAGDDQHVHARGGALGGEGGDHVVGLVARRPTPTGSPAPRAPRGSG